VTFQLCCYFHFFLIELGQETTYEEAMINVSRSVTFTQMSNSTEFGGTVTAIGTTVVGSYLVLKD